MGFINSSSTTFLFTQTRTCAHRVLLSPTRAFAPFARRLNARVFPYSCISSPTTASSIYSDASTEISSSRGSGNYSLKDGLSPPPSTLRGGKGDDMATRYDPTKLESLIYEWWESGGYFHPDSGTKVEEKDNPFTICMPPPNVTGNLHMGHAMIVAVEDIMVRYNRMKGRPCLWLPGKDHAGIATQLVVAKHLAKQGIDYKSLPREEFLEKIWNWKHEKHEYISKQKRRLGASCDWNRERFTLDDDMCFAVNHAFVTLHNRGLIYRGDYMVNWSPGLQTAVSDIEVEFKEEKTNLYYFNYPVEGGGQIPVATTRPETILGDTAICVHPEDLRYKKFIGKNAIVPIIGRKIRIIADEYVDAEFGTGALKITPGHDTNDYELGKRHNLEIINIMNRDATLNENAREFSGIDRFEAREKVWERLGEDGLAIEVKPHESRVPRSQRGGEIIEPLVSTQWFVKMDDMAARAVKVVREKNIKIVPERFEKIYYNWLENIRDWCVSRQLVWGHRIPVWNVVEHASEYIVAHDESEARIKAEEKFGAGVTLEQETDVLDTWFSSGLWPFATMGWPNKDSADFKRFFPGSVLETGYDILFFWVSRMIMMSLELTGEIPFETVYLHGLVNDEKGRKMSKSIGNVIDPLDTIEQYGTDALRYSLITGSTPGQDIPLSMEKVEANRNFANKLWNATRFIISNLENIDESEYERLASIAVSNFGNELIELPLAERYIISRLNELIGSVSRALESYMFGDAGRQIYEFLWDEFAAWYVEIAKSRLYADTCDDETSKIAARNTRATLVYVLDNSLRLLHPLMPFVTEALWQRLPRSAMNGGGEQALITAQWPQEGMRDRDAEERFMRVQAIIRAVRNARAEYDVPPGNRIPAVIRASTAILEDVESERGVFLQLAKMDVSFGEEEYEGKECLTISVERGLDVIIPMNELIDYEKERARLEKQIARLTKDRDGLARRLEAPGFVQKAPEKVVRSTKENKEKLDGQLRDLSNRLSAVVQMASKSSA